MSTKFTKDNLNDIITEAVVDTLNYNNLQAVCTVRGGFAQRDQTYFERYSNNKDGILKSAGVELSAIPKNVNIESLLVAKQIADLINYNPELQEIRNHFSNGKVKIDTATTLSTLKLNGDDLIKNAASDVLLRVRGIPDEPIGKGFEVWLPALCKGSFPAQDLVHGLKVAGEYVTESLVEIKNKALLKVDEKPASRINLKI